MKKFRYYSTTEKKWFKVYASVGTNYVHMLDENKEDFGDIHRAGWDAKKELELIKEDWGD